MKCYNRLVVYIEELELDSNFFRIQNLNSDIQYQVTKKAIFRINKPKYKKKHVVFSVSKNVYGQS